GRPPRRRWAAARAGGHEHRRQRGHNGDHRATSHRAPAYGPPPTPPFRCRIRSARSYPPPARPHRPAVPTARRYPPPVRTTHRHPPPRGRVICMTDGLIAVTGATGGVGGRVARRLADAGQWQRLLVRDLGRAPRLAGAEVARASYDDPVAMRRALRGVHTLFLVSAHE